MEEHEFSAGDLVRLASGGPVMTVMRVEHLSWPTCSCTSCTTGLSDLLLHVVYYNAVSGTIVKDVLPSTVCEVSP